MSIPASCRSEFETHGRLIPTLAGSGPEQMAFDALLLEHCQNTNNPGPVLRFYLWEGSWLSLGRHQTPRSNHWLDLVKSGRLAMVRRPSGGGAVLHGGGLTYALIWPHPPRQRREAYRRVNSWIASGLARLGLELHPGDDQALAGSRNCFASATTADLVDPAGHKRIGSAQFWQRGHLLQHGEIPLAPSQQLWQDVFGTTPPCWQPCAPSAASVEAALTEAIAELWPGLSWNVTPISSKERQLISERAAGYEVNESEVSSNIPEARMDVTAWRSGKPKG
ncbi:lipoate--protein ligase family protein [Synechococcus sp. UW179B]|uniref:lipoyl protein ligase domain-containing protein n=1 Tax=Synechococcus sp. UW179B TaxID=2575516 RepID=UPI000E0E7AF1|nr:lipoate--protein ligase family protein [Synechococcus sp. UW179B]